MRNLLRESIETLVCVVVGIVTYAVLTSTPPGPNAKSGVALSDALLAGAFVVLIAAVIIEGLLLACFRLDLANERRAAQRGRERNH